MKGEGRKMAKAKSVMLSAIQEFCPEDIQKQLHEALRHGHLEAQLYALWARYVPFVYSNRPDGDAAREERKARRILFRPLETFLCDGDPDAAFRQLKDRDHPPQLCGKVFKMGEPTYFCRDCGVDPTCVLCIECFQHSAHKKHRYKMSASGGGGYCDCGDREAWKEEPFCDIHKRGLNRQPEESPVDNLPADLRDRAEKIFVITVQYAVKLLTWSQYDSPPPNLRPETMDDSYVTMLFNDEVHTYEQVISTLQRAVECSQKEAIELATTTDREGRAIARRGTFDDCEKARSIIERQTMRQSSRPLITHVMHTSVVAHQTFALKILTWLQTVIKHSDGLRQLFCQLLLAEKDGTSVVKRMMLADTQLWKAARILSHQLFMAGVLMDPDSKRQFSVIFTQLYPELMKQFVDDDHDHSVCAVSESVQIFTVPTLARMLITEHNLLQVIMDAFLLVCQTKINKHGKFAFERQDRNVQQFRRANYMLYDLKYALVAKPNPEDWTDALRQNFMNGFRAFIQVLRAMEGMDAVSRQTSHHVEFEPEWEGAFNLHLKLADNIAIIIDWCCSDEQVLLEALGVTLGVIHSLHSKENVPTLTESLAGHTHTCAQYDVASQPVYIHLPVTRLLAGFLPGLSRLGLPLADLLTQHGAQLSTLIEPSLRALVLVAQVQAQMWRRNGYSLLNQVYFYQNVKCRTEMYDKDIVLLQAAASLMDPNAFLLQLLLRFGLAKWARQDAEKNLTSDESSRQLTILAEELLNLLIVLIGERYVPGVGDVTAEDATKREIIHQLCIQPMAHSELSKALPDDPYHETGIEEVVQQVADFKKPTGAAGKGMYHLKEECYQMYNPFFYHYTRADQSKSEEAQRKRRKQRGLNAALPPPCPPAALGCFQGLVRLLGSDVLHSLLRLVLQRAQAKYARCWSETQLEKALHLIALALHEEQRGTLNFTSADLREETSLYHLLQQLLGHPNLTHDAQKDLLAWTIAQYDAVRKQHQVEPRPSAAPPPDPSTERERQRKAALAAKRRAQVMKRMTEMQRNFIQENAQLFESTNTELTSTRAVAMETGDGPSSSSDGFPTALGPKRSPPSGVAVKRETCILCQEEQDVTHDGRALVLAAFVQRSTVLSKSRGKTVEDPESYDPLFMPSDLAMGAHTSTCGHVMHADCWQRFFDAILAKERRRSLRFRHHISYDIDKLEFLCPLCECLSNTVMPLIPHLSTLVPTSAQPEVELSMDDWLDGLRKTVRNSIKEAQDKESEEEHFLLVPCPLALVMKTMSQSAAKNFQALFDYVYDDASAHFSDSITDMLRKFSTDVYATGLGVYPNDENGRVPIMAWSTCAFTVMTVEQCLREEGKPLFGSLSSRQADCLSALVKFAAVSSQVITSDVVKKHCVTLLSALVCDGADHRLPGTPEGCVLSVDLFHLLVALCLSLPTLYSEEDASHTFTRIPTAGLNDLHLLRLTFTAHLVQIILTSDLPTQGEEAMEIGRDEDSERLLQLVLELRRLAGLRDPVDPPPCPWRLQQMLNHAALPFLRCSALFFHYLTGVAPPEALLIENCGEEFELLCHYLALPNCLTMHLTSGHILAHLVNSWCREEAVSQRLQEGNYVRHPMQVNQLVTLPADYSELINQVSTFTCPKSDGDDSRAPTLCLVCGAMLCSQSYCCQTEMNGTTVGAATAHAHTCGAGTGVFLRVRECQVLLMSGKTKGCFFAPPYLDDYGETDQGLRRGNPLHLCPERYQRLHRCWLGHSIPEQVSHLLETNANLMSIEWQHL